MFHSSTTIEWDWQGNNLFISPVRFQAMGVKIWTVLSTLHRLTLPESITDKVFHPVIVSKKSFPLGNVGITVREALFQWWTLKFYENKTFLTVTELSFCAINVESVNNKCNWKGWKVKFLYDYWPQLRFGSTQQNWTFQHFVPSHLNNKHHSPWASHKVTEYVNY